MFGRDRKNKNCRAPSTGTVAADEGRSWLPGENNGNAKTVIGEHVAVEGHFKGWQDLVIEGAVKGTIDIRPHDLEVGPGGRVEAEIRAQNVSLRGRLWGSVDALERVVIARQAEFFGNIKTRRLAVEDGACFKAMIELAAPPAAQKKED